jgi:1-acyl-sn-glycerol-3-phosphate acyltransferase
LDSALPARAAGLAAELWRHVCGTYLKIGGWRMRGDWPSIDKCVLIAAPHTSNWDGLNMIAAAGYYRVKLAWMGKASLTRGPFGWLIKALGCVPVDRSGGNDTVAQMKAAFDRAERLVLAVSPEGTRAKTAGWRSGFYHIAHGAGVPLVFSVLDYGTRTISLTGHLYPSGDYPADLALIQTHYATAKGKHAAKFTLEPS